MANYFTLCNLHPQARQTANNVQKEEINSNQWTKYPFIYHLILNQAAMKKLLTLLISCLPFLLLAQNSNVGINTVTPDSSAVLDINSTTGGLLVPRMSLFQRDIINNPATGLLVYQTDYNAGFYYYNGVRWRPFNPLAINGLTLDSTIDRIQLGGPLIKNTNIPLGTYNMAFDLDSSGVFEMRTNNTPFFHANNDGRIGIGTTSPVSQLMVEVDSAARGFEVHSAFGSSHIPYSNGWSYLAGQGIIFRTTAANTEQVRIMPNGFTGFGTNAPTQRLHSSGNLQVDGRHIYFGPNQSLYGDDAVALFYKSNSSDYSQFTLRDAEDTSYGHLYGSLDGTNFGLLDGDGNWGYLQAKDDYTAFRIDNDNKMIIRANGHVGIGTNSPGGKLTVMVDSLARGLQVFTANGNTHIPWSNGWSYLAGEGIVFRTTSTNTERVRIMPNGFTGFGVTAPAQQIHAAGNLRVDGRRIYFGTTQNLIGDNNSALFFDGAHPTITQFILRDLAGNQQGRLYGSSSGANFGLLDSDANWSVRIIKDQDTRFLIDNVEHYRFTPNSLEFHNFNNNIAIGRGIEMSSVGDGYNIGIGINALSDNSWGEYNVGIGNDALYNNSNGNDNVGIGSDALFNNSIGDDNIGIGRRALFNISNGDRNIGIGYNSLNASVNGAQNTVVGFRSGEAISAHSDNAFFGAFAGRQLLGLGNTCVGMNSGVAGSVPTSYSYSVAIGHNSRITASNQVRIGTSLTTSIGGFEDWTKFSDGQFKSNIKEEVPGLDFIMKLRPVTYHLNTEKLKMLAGINEAVSSSADLQEAEKHVKNKLETGFVAQEVEAAAKTLGYEFSGVDQPQSDNDHYGLRYSTFVVPLVQAVQDQQEIINKQQKMIEDLMNRVKQLEQNK